MKKLLLLAMVMTLSMTMSLARDKKAENVKTTTFVADIHCENCSLKVMNNVPALGKGIKDVAVDVAQKTITVTYDAAKNNDENIVKGLKSLNVNAQPQAVKPCCKVQDECQDKASKPCCNDSGECPDKGEQPNS